MLPFRACETLHRMAGYSDPSSRICPLDTETDSRESPRRLNQSTRCDSSAVVVLNHLGELAIYCGVVCADDRDVVIRAGGEAVGYAPIPVHELEAGHIV